MNVNEQIACQEFPCLDIQKDRYVIPNIDLEPQSVSMLMISEAAPVERKGYYYGGGQSGSERRTLEVFKRSRS